MLKIALAAENSKIVDGVREGFETFFPDDKISISYYEMNSSIKRELLEGEIFTTIENKLKYLRKRVDQEIDFFVVVQGGLFSKGGNYFYSLTSTVIKTQTRGMKIFGISPGFQIVENKILDILNLRFDNVVKDSELMVMTNLSSSLAIMAKQSVEMALSAYNW